MVVYVGRSSRGRAGRLAGAAGVVPARPGFTEIDTVGLHWEPWPNASHERAPAAIGATCVAYIVLLIGSVPLTWIGDMATKTAAPSAR